VILSAVDGASSFHATAAWPPSNPLAQGHSMTAIPCRVAIQNLFEEDPHPRSVSEVIEALQSRFPGEWTDGTVRAHLAGLSTNHPSAHYYPHLQRFTFLTQASDGRYFVAPPSGPELQGPAPPTVPAKTDRLLGKPYQPKARPNRVSRMAERCKELAANFAHYLAQFEKRSVFGGPSVHFHVRAIERRRTHESVRSAVADDELLELIYAMLASWGMHRMGPKGTKLVDFDPFCERIRRQCLILEELEPLEITDLDDSNAVADMIWRAVSDARLSASATQVVAGTKTLHHLLPDLIPPIDREYTIRFFHENKMMNMGDEAAFKEVYPALAEIASRARDNLKVNNRSPMNTSPTKILDNAIIGYVWSKLKVQPEEE
jgi:hypothetical protein